MNEPHAIIHGTTRWDYDEQLPPWNFSEGNQCRICGIPTTNGHHFCRLHGRRWRAFKERVLRAAREAK